MYLSLKQIYWIQKCLDLFYIINNELHLIGYSLSFSRIAGRHRPASLTLLALQPTQGDTRPITNAAHQKPPQPRVSTLQRPTTSASCASSTAPVATPQLVHHHRHWWTNAPFHEPLSPPSSTSTAPPPPSTASSPELAPPPSQPSPSSQSTSRQQLCSPHQVYRGEPPQVFRRLHIPIIRLSGASQHPSSAPSPPEHHQYHHARAVRLPKWRPV